jgi:penicillin amidase
MAWSTLRILDLMGLNTTLIKNAKENPEEFLAISKSVTALLDNSPIPPFIGSNSWVIAQKN